MTQEKSHKKLRKLLPLFIIVGAVLLMVIMISTRKQPATVEPVNGGALVETMIAKAVNAPAIVNAQGTVRPHREIALALQVSGKIDWISPEFVSGGSFRKGDLMLRIEEIDYQLAVDQAEAAVAQAEYQYSLAKAQAGVAAQEWERLNKDSGISTEEPDALVLHGPQLKQAEANLSSAQARLQSAQLNLERTSLRAPFDCRIRDEMADLGQFVNPGQAVARIYSTDLVEIDVRLPLNEMQWLEIPGSPAVVRVAGLNGMQWDGYVHRGVGVIDSIGRLAKAVVRIDNPFTPNEKHSVGLNIGAFVNITIEGRMIEHNILLPRSSLRSDSVVWIVADDSTLDIRRVEVDRTSRDEAFISKGVREGEQVVLTALVGAAQGTKLRPVLKESTQ
ncbi:efflux RND transporter periplasmic adaptor subunit [bacterium]|nr:efflux RND transporter periplasmic adaptor subunit [bacterium]